MTSKEKAKELYHRYHSLGSDFTRGVSMHEFAKQCALIAVDEIIEMIKRTIPNSPAQYQWQQVKNDIELL